MKSLRTPLGGCFWRLIFQKAKLLKHISHFLVSFAEVYDVWPCYDLIFGTIVILMLNSFCLLFIVCLSAMVHFTYKSL